MRIRTNLQGVDKKIHEIATNRNVGLFLAQECFNSMEQYIPKDTGALISNHTIEPFRITFNQPYASVNFYGTERKFSTEKNINAQAHWDVPVQTNHANGIAKAITDYLRRI